MKKLFKKYFAVFVLCTAILCLSACALTENQNSKAEKVIAAVVEIEKYGHAVLDITATDFADAGYNIGDVVFVSFDSYESDMPYYDGYYATPGKVMLRGINMEDNIALCINYGDFSAETGIAVGDVVEITMTEKEGMLAFQQLCALKYSNNREDYPDDVIFTNFREVTEGRIGEGKLYRIASPINNENGRAKYSNAIIESVGIATAINLADSAEDIEEYSGAEDYVSEYYMSLYENGKVIVLDMTANFFSDKYAYAIVDGLNFMAENEAPYCVHCTEGKDRTGYVIMLLEALMGADLDEIIDDYMLSFKNYYGITKEDEPERYQAVFDNNLMAMLFHMTGAESIEELEQMDLEAAATDYLLRSGMAEEDIITLKEKLS